MVFPKGSTLLIHRRTNWTNPDFSNSHIIQTSHLGACKQDFSTFKQSKHAKLANLPSPQEACVMFRCCWSCYRSLSVVSSRFSCWWLCPSGNSLNHSQISLIKLPLLHLWSPCQDNQLIYNLLWFPMVDYPHRADCCWLSCCGWRKLRIFLVNNTPPLCYQPKNCCTAWLSLFGQTLFLLLLNLIYFPSVKQNKLYKILVYFPPLLTLGVWLLDEAIAFS